MARKSEFSRRKFLKVASAGAAALSAAGCQTGGMRRAGVPGAPPAKSMGRVIGANDRINFGIIGLGTIATHGHRPALIQIQQQNQDNIDVVAVCDCWKSRMPKFTKEFDKKLGKTPDRVDDYRRLLDRNDIDVITICTPEHWHAQMIVEACEAGKHVYTEKPMTHSIPEALEVLDAIKRTGRIVQVGIQGMSDDSYISAQHAIKAGKIGKVLQAQIDYVRWYPPDAGPWRTGHKSDEPKPTDLDWQMWLGPAQKRDWDARRYFDWRAYWDYSGGIATDLFVHRMARIIKACDLKEPKRAVGVGGIWLWDDGRDIPDQLEIILEYPDAPTVYVLGTMGNDHGLPHLIRGYEGTLIFTDTGFDIYPQGKGKDQSKPIFTHKKTGAEDIRLHHLNHNAAIRAANPSLLNCPPELGYYAVVAVCMANESYKRKAYMQWNPSKRTMQTATA